MAPSDYVTKRLNYYNGQLLGVDDFKDEQLHHDRERELRGRMFQVWGITEGLVVTVPGSTTIQVGPGAAMDGEGRLILLVAPTAMSVAPNTPPGLNYIVITYAEQPSDPAAPQNVPGSTRIAGVPTLSLRTLVGPGEVVLGRVQVIVASGGALAVDPQSLDTSVRAYAGARLPGPGDAGFDLRTWGDDRVSLERYQAGDAGFTKLVSVSSSGNVGVGVANPAQRFVVAGRVGVGFNDSSQTADLAILGNVGVGTGDPKGALHVVGDVALGLDQDDKRFVLHSGAVPDDGDYLQITSDSASGDWDWANGIALRRGGNVGVGTTSPQHKLDVNGDARVQGAIIPSVGDGPANGIQFPSDPGGGADDTAFIRYFVTQPGTQKTKLLIGVTDNTDAANEDTIGLSQAGVEVLTVANQSIGIGTASPQAKLHVNGGVRVESGNVGLGVGAPAQQLLVVYGRVGIGTNVAAQTAELAINIAGTISIGTNDKVDNDAIFANKIGSTRITIRADQSNSAVFRSMNDVAEYTAGVTGNRWCITDRVHQIEPLTIAFNSNVGINTQSPSERLHVVGNARIDGNLQYTSGGQSSSRALKDAIRGLPADEALTVFRALRPVTFTFKADPAKRTQAGFIAEEVPELVATEDRAAINPVTILSVLTRVVQLQQETIERLERRIEALT